MKRGGRAVREREERARIAQILAREPSLCLDCGTVRFKVSYAEYQDRFDVVLYHLRDCPVRRSSWSMRACDDYLRALLIIAGLSLADYNCHVEAVHV